MCRLHQMLQEVVWREQIGIILQLITYCDVHVMGCTCAARSVILFTLGLNGLHSTKKHTYYKIRPQFVYRFPFKAHTTGPAFMALLVWMKQILLDNLRTFSAEKIFMVRNKLIHYKKKGYTAPQQVWINNQSTLLQSRCLSLPTLFMHKVHGDDGYHQGIFSKIYVCM